MIVFAQWENIDAMKWIDVNVIPPPIHDRVLIRLIVEGEAVVDVGILDADGCWTTFNDWDEGFCFEVTHWMPVPYADIE